MTRTARTILALFTVAVAACSFGCASGSVAMTAHERQHQHDLVRTRDREALRDDWDMIWLNDRPTRLTRWHDR